MAEIGFFSELDGIMNKAISDHLLASQDLCKLLYYYPTEPSFKFNPLVQPNVDDATGKLLMKHIFPMPKMPDATTEKKSYILISLVGEDTPDNDHSGFRTVRIIFDIIVHLDSWIIKTGYRPFKIASAIDKIFNNQQTNLPVFNKPVYAGFVTNDYGYNFYGIQLAYDVIVKSNIVCGVPQSQIGG